MAAEELGSILAGGNLVPLPPNASQEDQINALNGIIRRLNAELKSQTFSDGQSKRFLNGYFAGGWPGGDFGMKISAAGYDVTDPNAVLIFSWDYTTNQQIVYNNGIPRLLRGSAPADGRAGDWISDDGIDVTTVIGTG